jgi:hypothetical protein
MKNEKLIQDFKMFLSNNSLYQNSVIPKDSGNAIVWYNSVADGKKALVFLQQLIGGKILDDGKTLETYTNKFTVLSNNESGQVGVIISTKVKEDYIYQQHKQIEEYKQERERILKGSKKIKGE